MQQGGSGSCWKLGAGSLHGMKSGYLKVFFNKISSKGSIATLPGSKLQCISLA
jgi:hypothetical protein